jgi:MraZ protein
MTSFSGTHDNRLDAKGRVSVPALFRAAAKGEAETLALYLRPSKLADCVEAWVRDSYDTYWQAKIDALPEGSMERVREEARAFGSAVPVEADAQGRIIIPEKFLKRTGIADTVRFIGMGRYIQIWEPGKGQAFMDAMLGDAS